MASIKPPTDHRHARQHEAHQFLNSRLNYERVHTHRPGFKLQRMRALCEAVGNPQDAFPAIHVAGTKGKGSTSAMLSAILHAAGYRTGLYSSPHLFRPEERIQVAGQSCEAETFARLVQQIRPAVAMLDEESPGAGPTYFEITTAMALMRFAEMHVDIGVLEVGLGGTRDSTNVCRPNVCVITSISLDHMAQLGNTLTAIAREKAGIIKPGVPVISGAGSSAANRVIEAQASQLHSPLIQAGRDFHMHYRGSRVRDDGVLAARFRLDEESPQPVAWNDVELPLPGRHQAKNASLALAAISELRRQGWKIADPDVRQGLTQIQCRARIQLLSKNPAVVIDVAHNAASMQALVDVLEECFGDRRKLLVFATSGDKDIPGMTQVISDHFSHVVLTRFQGNPRGCATDRLRDEMLRHAPSLASRLELASCPQTAITAAQRRARASDVVCVAGSFFLAAELEPMFGPAPGTE